MYLKGMYQHLTDALQSHSIGRRLLLSIILFSSLVTLLATGVQLYTDYQRDLGLIKNRLTDIESSYLASISASLWNLDVDQLLLQLEGIRHLPDVEAVSITESSATVPNPLHIQQGEFRQSRALHKAYPILHESAGELRQIGTLKVQASLEEVYSRLWDKVIVILLSQGVKTFIVSLFILLIFYRLVTTHLISIAQHVSRYDLTQLPPRLHLQRKATQQEDELDQMVNAFNTLSDNLKQAYDHMCEVNLALADDIIARKQAEAEVKHLNAILEQRVHQRTAELQAANNELASFCYSVSHDLRAPLRRIEGFRRMLGEEAALGQSTQAQHYLQRIESGTREMAEMIDSFLRLARTTQSELHLEEVDLSREAENLLRQLQERDPERRVTWSVEPGMMAHVDRRFFSVLLGNLLDNAWKYTSREAQASITFGRQQGAEGWVYCVSDNGAGFDMKYADRLFSPFSRLHKNEEFEGVGIGLATVYRIVSRHGGRIWAESSPGDGTSFYFSLWQRNKDSESGDNTAGGR